MWVPSLERKNPWKRAWQPTPVFVLGEFQGQRSLAGYRPQGHRESGMTEQLSTHKHCCYCSVTKSRPTICHPMDCNMLPCPSLSPGVCLNSCSFSQWCYLTFSSCPQSFPASGSFPMGQLFASGVQSTGASASPWVLPMNIQGWFSLGLTGLISLESKGLSESSPAPQFKSINSLVLSLLCGLTLTSINDYWKNHSLDWMALFWQRDVSSF